MIKREATKQILADIKSGPSLIRAIVGPRQVGKSTAAQQVAEDLKLPSVIESADSALPHSSDWISLHWQRARRLTSDGPALLVLDEIQKVSGWSEEVKRLWDEDQKTKLELHVLILGSSALLIQQGLTESLAGRFFLYPFLHWSFKEMHLLSDWTLNEWIYFGGYPGAAVFRNQEDKWKSYVADSLVETAIARDVLGSKRIAKPALLHQLFGLAVTHPARILSYNKMLGQLQDAGNTTTLAEYLKLLGSAQLVHSLELFSKGKARMRASSPKLIPQNNALVNALSTYSYESVENDPAAWGWLVENAVGVHLTNSLSFSQWSLSYWRKGNAEVDFVIQSSEKIIAIEVKSGRPRKLSGINIFQSAYPQAKTLLLGEAGIPLKEFFEAEPETFL